MLKKLSLLALVSACSMSLAAPIVTMDDNQVATILRAQEIALADGVEAPLVAQYAAQVAQGNRDIDRDERNELFNEVYEQLGRESGQAM